mmetsp:Transcript_34904/g.91359  ORF Transcript_34904/g.91359 Transcript_34904/m.91359 type:complete len:703 (+) Transcript_34904:97-2205(+)
MIRTALVCGMAAFAVAQRPAISSDMTDVTINAATGAVKVVDSGSICTSSAPCSIGGLAAQIQTLQAAVTTLNQTVAFSTDVASTYLTAADAMSTYATQASLSSYTTNADSIARNDATRLYAETLVDQLANLTLNQSQAAAIISSHQALGVLHGNGTFFGDIVVSGDSDFVTMLPLLNHVVYITGNLRITNVYNSVRSFGPNVFTNIQTIGGDLYIWNCRSLTSLGDRAFPALTSVGGTLTLGYNQNLNANGLSTAFPVLTTIGGGFVITQSPNLGNSVGSAFARLNSLAGVPLGSNFNAQTGIFVGDVYMYNSNANSMTLQAATTRLANVAILTGQLYIRDQTFTSLGSFGQNLRSIGGQLYLYNNDGLTSLDGTFPNLGYIGGNLYMYSNSNVQTFGSAFANVRMVRGSVTIRYMSTRLTSLANAFPQLRNVTGSLNLQNLDYVTSLDSAFPQLRWVNTYVYLYYMRRLGSVGSNAFQRLEYAGGVRSYYSWYYSAGSTSTRNMNGAFPALLRVGRYGIYFYRNYYLYYMNNAFPALVRCDSYHYNYYSNRLISIQNSFPRLPAVNSYFQLTYQYALTSVSGSFNALTSVSGYMYLYYNTVLPNFNNAFTNLQSVSGNFYIYRCYRLTTPGTGAFQNLRSVGRLYWYGLGSSSRYSSAQSSWCTNARSRFCPSTSTYSNAGWSYDSDTCCNSYCRSSPTLC